MIHFSDSFMIQSLNWLDDEEVEFEKTCIKGLLVSI